MASMAQQFNGLRCAPLSSSRLSKPFSTRHLQNRARSLPVQAAVITSPIPSPQVKERFKLKEIFEEAYERCRNAPVEGISFTVEDFHSAIEKYDFNSEVGTKVKGTVFCTDGNGALVDITAKSSAYLPLQEACIHRIKHVEEAGVYPGLRQEFVIIGENEADDSLVLSLRSIQYDLAWERCRQLQAEDVVVKGKVVDANKGGVVAVVEGLRGFVPFSQISTKSTAEELLMKEIPLKFVEVDEEQSRLVLSNRKAVADSQAQLGIGSVVIGTVQSLKPYGAFIDIGGVNGLLHVSQISHDRISDIATVLQPGDTLKVMILSHDRERGRVSLSTKKLEPTPGDMIRNPKLVFEKAEEMAQTFRQRIAYAEAMARADMLKFQPEVLREIVLHIVDCWERSPTSANEGVDHGFINKKYISIGTRPLEETKSKAMRAYSQSGQYHIIVESGLTLTTDGILGPMTPELPVEGLDLNDVPPAEE